ncbi:MAG: hypothetical protein KA020_02900 [Planctomycetes bacterium]|nr:hypothetical protein [Planctomycetota bacterium]
MLRLGIAPLLALLASAAPPQTPEPRTAPAGTDPSLQQFGNLSKTFHVDVPKGWRQISPKEALLLSEKPTTPVDLRRAEPRSQYAVGPVDQWLSGDLGGAWLLVTEIGEEAVIPEDYAAQLREMWHQHSAATGIGQEISDIQREKIGPQHHPVITARRTASAPNLRPTRSLDVYASSGRQQITLSFTTWAEEFDRWEPRFRTWLQTAAFARPPKEGQKLSDRLWTPLITGGVVAILLIALYKHTHRER